MSMITAKYRQAKKILAIAVLVGAVCSGGCGSKESPKSTSPENDVMKIPGGVPGGAEKTPGGTPGIKGDMMPPGGGMPK